MEVKIFIDTPDGRQELKGIKDASLTVEAPKHRHVDYNGKCCFECVIKFNPEGKDAFYPCELHKKLLIDWMAPCDYSMDFIAQGED